MRFEEDLIGWYKVNKRDLPWRKSKDPYVIWLSEIILQQTRVNQGLEYFNSFLEHFPTVNKLAEAPIDKVLKLWQGLGYYSRARNLHFTAQYIVNELNGEFPSTHKDILKLKGIGEYTAAAISSFSYDMPYPVIDGNVYRVLSRVFGIESPIDSSKGKLEFKELANQLIDKKNPAIYNQSIMEFGALQCKPNLPNCENCVFRLDCFAFKNNRIDTLPFKQKKIKQRNRFFNYLILKEGSNIFIKQRGKNDIWEGLFDFPLIETKKDIQSLKSLQLNDTLPPSCNLNLINKSDIHKHILSHQKIFATFWMFTIDKTDNLNKDYLKIDMEEIHNYAVPKLIENYIKSIV